MDFKFSIESFSVFLSSWWTKKPLGKGPFAISQTTTARNRHTLGCDTLIHARFTRLCVLILTVPIGSRKSNRGPGLNSVLGLRWMPFLFLFQGLCPLWKLLAGFNPLRSLLPINRFFRVSDSHSLEQNLIGLPTRIGVGFWHLSQGADFSDLLSIVTLYHRWNNLATVALSTSISLKINRLGFA